MTGRKPITYALALTLDDGVNSDVARLHTQFPNDTGLRLTYFVNGTYRSWTENRYLLRPVDLGLAVRYLISHVSHSRNIR